MASHHHACCRWLVASLCPCQQEPPSLGSGGPVVGPTPPADRIYVVPAHLVTEDIIFRGNGLCLTVGPNSQVVCEFDPELMTVIEDVSEQFDTCDECCGRVEACCLPDGTCVNLPPGECVAQGGHPGGPDTSCADLVGCAQGNEPPDCVAAWVARGCPSEVVCKFTDVLLKDDTFECPAPDGGNVLFSGPYGHPDWPDNCLFTCSYKDQGLTILGPNDCGGDLWTFPSFTGENFIRCCGILPHIDCHEWVIRIKLKCLCPDEAAFTNSFEWHIPWAQACIPRGDLGAGEVVDWQQDFGQTCSLEIL